MNELIIPVKTAKEQGVNFDNVERCRQIRKLAMAGRFEIDDSTHSSNANNKHLFSYIEYCGLSLKEYLRSYLSNLQPYMLEHRADQEKSDTMICVLDNAYRVSLYIKVDRYKGSELVISFHENVRAGFLKENNMKRDTVRLSHQIVPVFAEPTGAYIEGSDRQQVKVFIQRGMLLLPAMVMAQKCENNTYLVERGSLEQPIVDACNQYLRDLYTSNLDLKALENVEYFSVLQQMSFTSYGNTIFSNISLLIDNLEIQNGSPSKRAADFALVTYIDNLYLSSDQAIELIDVLKTRYFKAPSIGFEKILDRVIDEIEATADKTQKIIDTESVSNSKQEEFIEKHNTDYVPAENHTIQTVSFRHPGR